MESLTAKTPRTPGRFRMARRLGTSLAIWGLLNVFLALGASAQPLRPIVISSSSFTPNEMVPLWIAEEMGFFKKYGLEASIVYIESGSRSAQAFAAGEVNLGVLAGPTMINAAAGGLDLVMVCSLVDRLYYGLVAVPSVTRVEDLRGKVIGISRFGSATQVIVQLALEHFGLDVRRDQITLLQIGGQPIRAAALAKGVVQATVFDLPVAQRVAEQEKLTFLQDLSTLRIPYQHTGLVTSRAYLRAHPDMVERGVRSALEAMAFAVTPANKAQVMRTIAARLRLDAAEKAEGDYAGLLKVYERYPVPNGPGLASLIRVMARDNPKVAKVRADELFDLSLLEKLQGEGFLHKLFTRP